MLRDNQIFVGNLVKNTVPNHIYYGMIAKITGIDIPAYGAINGAIEIEYIANRQREYYFINYNYIVAVEP